MAIPKLETPVHSLTLPSSGEQIKFRPFLVKEQKLMILADEGNKDPIKFLRRKLIIQCVLFLVLRDLNQP